MKKFLIILLVIIILAAGGYLGYRIYKSKTENITDLGTDVIEEPKEEPKKEVQIFKGTDSFNDR